MPNSPADLIRDNVRKLLAELPAGVKLVAAAKSRTPEEVLQAIEAGITAVGENYVQEAREAFEVIGRRAEWHFIGHLQRNKVKKAAEIFDMIETLDSERIAAEIDAQCAAAGKRMAVLIEVNSGREPQKFGAVPDEVPGLVQQLAGFKSLRVEGLMTMGPEFGDPEAARPYFRETRRLFESLKTAGLPGVSMTYLSMGMSNSYRVALEEGANMVRLGTKIFGPRP